MFEVNDQVRIRPAGVSVFRIVEIDDEHALIESVDEAPGRYPFSVPLTDLHPAE
ncbi:hypothetical protein [Nocardia higoensis]|uniref:hypothetical protein n=1 Tax=Nocardia higoensis TaxID=228599 RepID=UPI001E415D16|nr:hypothetical protein [Nocardia higoensis]